MEPPTLEGTEDNYTVGRSPNKVGFPGLLRAQAPGYRQTPVGVGALTMTSGTLALLCLRRTATHIKHMGCGTGGLHCIAKPGYLWSMTPKDAKLGLGILRFRDKHGLEATADAF